MAQWWRASGAGVRAGLRNRSQTSSSSAFHTIQAIPREYSGSRVSARERAQGRIPAVVFSESFSAGSDGVIRSVSRKRLLTTEKKQIQAIMKSVESDKFFYSTRFPLQIMAGAGSSVLIESGNVLPVKIHKDKETGKILNLVLAWADDGSEMKVDVPVVIKGEDGCPGLKKGGYLNKIRPTLKYVCPAEHIPSKVEVDISSLDIGDKILMQDIRVHPSLKLISRNEVMPVVKIVAAKSESKEPATEDSTELQSTKPADL
uniref:Large ribosomal subunit protein bL25 beta domain-containing protein n=1 Tax=Kalanchoe fedtschenkoi TaxID=63787 RepID=A0A7N0T9L5_KALFE